jgi:hypothetical protein
MRKHPNEWERLLLKHCKARKAPRLPKALRVLYWHNALTGRKNSPYQSFSIFTTHTDGMVIRPCTWLSLIVCAMALYSGASSRRNPTVLQRTGSRSSDLPPFVGSVSRFTSGTDTKFRITNLTNLQSNGRSAFYRYLWLYNSL